MNADGLLIRPGSPADLKAVEAIEIASFGDPWVREAILQELIPSGLRFPLIAEIDGAVVGFLMAWRTPDQLHVLNVAVDPGRRRRGIGRSLLEAALAEARRCGFVEVTLEVRRGNEPALGMYREFGFRQEGIREGYYPDTGEDALILTLALDGG